MDDARKYSGPGVVDFIMANVLRRVGERDDDPSAIRAAKRAEVRGYEKQYPHLAPTMTKEEAAELFRQLYAKYGARWDHSVPESARETLRRISEVLSPDERREAVSKGNE